MKITRKGFSLSVEDFRKQQTALENRLNLYGLVLLDVIGTLVVYENKSAEGVLALCEIENVQCWKQYGVHILCPLFDQVFAGLNSFVVNFYLLDFFNFKLKVEEIQQKEPEFLRVVYTVLPSETAALPDSSEVVPSWKAQNGNT